MLSFGDQAAGLALCLAAVGPLVWGAIGMRARLLPGWRGAPAHLAGALLAVFGLLLVCEMLGAIGMFRRGALVGACAVVGLGLGAAARRGGGSRELPPPPAPPAAPAGRGALVATVAGVLVAGQWAIGIAAAYRHGMTGSDTLGYHLPIAARFVQDHQVFAPLFINADSTVTFLPHNGELLDAASILLMGSDVLVPVLSLASLALALTAAWTIGRPWGAGAATTLGVAIVTAWPALTRSQAGSADTDLLAVAFLLAAAALLVSAGTSAPGRETPLRPFALAGLACGLALGTKPTVLAAVGALTLGVLALAALDVRRLRDTPRGLAVRAGTWVGMLALGSGAWFVRNLVVAGNPFPWVNLRLGPIHLPDAGNRVGDAVSRYFGQPHIWSEVFAPGLHAAVGTAWPVVFALAVVGAIGGLARGHPGVVRVVGLAGAAALVGYLFTPNGAAGPPGFPVFFESAVRYSAPGAALGLAVLPLWSPAARLVNSRWGIAALALLLVISLRSAGFSTLDGTRLIVTLALLALIGLALAMRGTRIARAVPLVVLAALVPATWAVTTRYQRGRYSGPPYAFAHALRHARVATSGFYESYPLYGPDLSNRVRELGIRGPHGSFHSLATCRAWLRALRAGGYRWVAVAPRAARLYGRGAPPPSAGWTASIEGAVEVLRRPDGGRVYRLTRSPDPKSCR